MFVNNTQSYSKLIYEILVPSKSNSAFFTKVGYKYKKRILVSQRGPYEKAHVLTTKVKKGKEKKKHSSNTNSHLL